MTNNGPIPMLCLIDLDGAEYRYTAPLGYPTSNQKLAPGKEWPCLRSTALFAGVG